MDQNQGLHLAAEQFCRWAEIPYSFNRRAQFADNAHLILKAGLRRANPDIFNGSVFVTLPTSNAASVRVFSDYIPNDKPLRVTFTTVSISVHYITVPFIDFSAPPDLPAQWPSLFVRTLNSHISLLRKGFD